MNTRKWNGCIKAYKSHLFLDSLTSGNEQGLKVLSLPAKVLNAFSLSAESITEEAVETRESACRSDFAKRDPSLAQLRRQTDVRQDPSWPLIKYLLYPDSKPSSPPAQPPGQTRVPYPNPAARIPGLQSRERREQGGHSPTDHSSEHTVDAYISLQAY